MKILLLSDVYKYNTNGVAGVVVMLASTLRTMGHDVKVLSLSTTRESFREGDDYYLPSVPFPVYPEIRQSPVIIHPFIKEIKAWKPDIIHIHSEGSAARFGRSIARKTGAPLIMTVHTDYAKYVFRSHSEATILKLAAKPLASFFYRRADVVTTPSQKAKLLMQSYHFKKKISVVPNGIKLERFQKDFSGEERAEMFSRWEIPDNGKLFVIVSRLSKEKNIIEILDYFPSLIEQDPGVHLLVVGDGPDMQHLMRRAKEPDLDGHVIFTGRISQDDLYRYYKSGIAFLSASTFEMHSLTYLEALACGLPLICRDDPCLLGVLKDGVNGYTYREKEEFVSHCAQLIQDKEVRDRMAAASLRKSSAFSCRAMAKNMVRLYERMLKNN